MASSSTSKHIQSQSSAPKSTEPWDIFINHRGDDVKYTLATTIYKNLHSMGLHVFLDKYALEAGDSFPAEIHHAMATASLHIAIFSPNYAQSAWCLDELTFMLKTGKTVIPIFYHVEASDLRRVEKGKYAEAFTKHERKGRYTPEKLDEWKKALNKCSDLHGYPVNNNRDEASVLKNIVNDALKITKREALLSVAEHPVRLDELVQEFDSLAREETVKIRGIVGMGGSGKTTLAKELFNRNFSSFKRCSFVSDVRVAASKNSLPEKQKKLLKDLGVDSDADLHFDNVDEGKVILKNRLGGHGALIVLDDVDHIDQLNALFPNKDGLGSCRSMVIVTTRELGVLTSWRLSLSCIYNMPRLANPYALQLFCWHAFLQPSPPAEFQTLVEDFLKACNGLPLSLKVLGAQLYGNNSRAYWKAQLKKFSRILPSDIRQRLQVSYDALDAEDREMFLDVACFLIGIEESTAIALWDGSGWSGLHGLQTLLNKCLVELVEERVYGEVKRRTIRMHDQLRDMGREITSRQSPYRLWCPQHIDNLKKDSTEIKQIRGIQPADSFVAFKECTHQLIGNSVRRSKRLRFSYGLQILFVKGNEFTEEFASLSEGLVWLRWEHFPLRDLPSWLTLKYLRVLELRGASHLEGLWQDNGDPPLQLRELILTGSQLQQFTSSIECLQHLKKLVVDFHGSCLTDEICDLQSLEIVRLSSPMLSLLPNGFGNLTNLKNLSLENCEQLSMLPNSFSQLISLTDLSLSKCKKLSSLSDGFGNLTSLRNLDMWGCKKLSSLPDGFGNLSSLTSITLIGCKRLTTLPDSFTRLHLTELCLSECEMLSSLPDDFGNLSSLTSIDLTDWKRLTTLPNSFTRLHLTELCLSKCEMLSSLPDGFGNLTSLRNLDMWGCKKLSSLPDGFGNLSSLTSIDLIGCKRLTTLPDSFTRLHLTELCLSKCEMLSSLPDDFGNLSSLTSIDLTDCKRLTTLPNSFTRLHLTDLDLSGCEMLENVRCISRLINLETLKIADCPQIEELPSFANLASLKSFIMWYCPKVEKIEGLEQAKSLKVLSITTGWEVAGIQSLGNLERLEDLRLDCETMSAVKPCIHESIKRKECARKVWIKGSTIRLGEPIEKRLEEISDLIIKVLIENDDSINSFYTVPQIPKDFSYLYYVESEEGMNNVVVLISYSEDGQDEQDEDDLRDYFLPTRRAIQVSGKRERVLEAFYQILKLLE